jgi:hypothetical protein
VKVLSSLAMTFLLSGSILSQSPRSIHEEVEAMRREVDARHLRMEQQRLEMERERERTLVRRTNLVAEKWNEIDFPAFAENWNDWIKHRNSGVLDLKRTREISRQGKQIQELAKALKELEKTRGWPKQK